jgi:hypothetical protein
MAFGFENLWLENEVQCIRASSLIEKAHRRRLAEPTRTDSVTAIVAASRKALGRKSIRGRSLTCRFEA